MKKDYLSRISRQMLFSCLLGLIAWELGGTRVARAENTQPGVLIRAADHQITALQLGQTDSFPERVQVPGQPFRAIVVLKGRYQNAGWDLYYNNDKIERDSDGNFTLPISVAGKNTEFDITACNASTSPSSSNCLTSPQTKKQSEHLGIYFFNWERFVQHPEEFRRLPKNYWVTFDIHPIYSIQALGGQSFSMGVGWRPRIPIKGLWNGLLGVRLGVGLNILNKIDTGSLYAAIEGIPYLSALYHDYFLELGVGTQCWISYGGFRYFFGGAIGRNINRIIYRNIFIKGVYLAYNQVPAYNASHEIRIGAEFGL